MVYYRKYRPQNISELDLPDVRTRLEAILKAKELPHAFLFTGPKGLGKTSSARILAKAINCENKKGFEPCNECDVCKTITNGSNLDVIEIDAASNRGIDEIRDLRDKIKYAPIALRKKVYIIDEVHMLTNDAFNALLKTLEEPPSHAVFILCTTEIEKVPPTIVSRAFHVTFQKPTTEEIVRSLDRIVKGEKLEVEDGVLSALAELSDGAFRDAAKNLEELNLAANGGKITKDILEKSYKTQSTDNNVQNLIESLAKKDAKASLRIIDEMASQGSDFKVVTEKLAQAIHSLIIGGENKFNLSVLDLKTLLNLVNQSYKDIKLSVLPQIPLELVAIEWSIDSTNNSKQVIIQEGQAEHKPENKNLVPEERVEIKAEVKIDVPKHEEAKSPIGSVSGSNDKHKDMFHSNIKTDNFMAAFISVLKQDNHSVIGILRGCQLVGIEEGKVRFVTKYKFHKDKLNEPKMAALLNKRASEILKEEIQVTVDIV
ncbi:MAG TPA: DNA polymerase III subunit gamma/tau [Patescibacteria group bacterium]|nr:DNA polymerase III subunit gamma/tau [Patescibacteria group bacterium]